MLDTADPLVQFKLGLLERSMPADSAVVFGDMYRVDGGYAASLSDSGVSRVVVVDSLETPAWQQRRLAQPSLDFYKGDFSDPLFMASVRERFDIGVVYDVLLHQAPLLHSLHLMLDKVVKRLCFVQPMLEELEVPGGAVYLPGNAAADTLHPMSRPDVAEFNLFDERTVTHGNWLWGLTRSFFQAAVTGEGFAVVHESRLACLPNPRWYYYGCVAERSDRPQRHWSHFARSQGLHTAPW